MLSGFTYAVSGPEFLAHALPDGGFSRSDADAPSSAQALHGQNCGKRELLEKWATIDPPVRLP